MSDSNENVSKKPVSRRSVIKWTGALAATGVVGIGLGLGGDLLLRPNTTKTVAQVSTCHRDANCNSDGDGDSTNYNHTGNDNSNDATTTATQRNANGNSNSNNNSNHDSDD